LIKLSGGLAWARSYSWTQDLDWFPVDFSRNPTGDLLNSSHWWGGSWGVMWLGFVEGESRHWVNETSYLANDVMVNLWGSGRVCLGQGGRSVLVPVDKIPQDKNKTKSSHSLRSFSCDSCHRGRQQNWWVMIRTIKYGQGACRHSTNRLLWFLWLRTHDNFYVTDTNL